MIFDRISVKACWERWCRWNCDLRHKKKAFYCTEKKGIFCCTESVAMMPKSRDHMPTTSPLGSRCKMANSRISLNLSGRILKEYWDIVSASKQTPCGIPWGLRNRTMKCSLHKWAWCGAARKTACLNCINLIHFHLTAGRLRGSSCIVIPGVVCELLQFAATQ